MKCKIVISDLIDKSITTAKKNNYLSLTLA